MCVQRAGSSRSRKVEGWGGVGDYSFMPPGHSDQHGPGTEDESQAQEPQGPDIGLTAQTAAPAPGKRRNRGLIITAIGASYLVLAAGTAAAVVAIGSPAPVDIAALSSPSAGTAGASASATA